MACKIVFNANNTPKGVLNNEGKPSKLFDSILSNPHISNFNQALDIYLQAPQEGVLEYKTPSGDTFTSFKEALKASDINSEIELQVGGKTISKINTSLDKESVNGNINSLIKEGMLTGESYLDNQGRKVLKIEGNEDVKRMVVADVVRQELKANLGNRAVTFFKSGDFYINESNLRKNVTLTNKKGETEVVDREEILSKPFETVVNKYDEGLTMIMAREYKENTPAFGTPIEVEAEIIPENELQRKLLNLLKNFGIKTLSIANYVTNYSIKNGVEPSAQALADLANMVVAFKDGVVTTEDLTEETAHFIVASLSEEQKVDMKRNVHKTQQWLKYADYYMNVYSKTYSGQELDNVVREEILGKVLAESLIQRFSTEQATTPSEVGIIGRLQELFNEFIETIRAYFRPEYQNELNKFTASVYNNIINETLELDKNNIGKTGYTLYSTSNANAPELNKIQVKLTALLQSLTSQANELSKQYSQQGDKEILRKNRERLDKQINELTAESAILDLAKVGLSQVNTINKVLDKNTGKGYHFTQEENSVFINFKTRTIPILNQLLPTIQDKVVKQKISDILLGFAEIEGRVKTMNSDSINRMIERTISKHNLTQEQANKYREEMKIILTKAQEDTDFLHAHIGSLLHARNGLLNLAGSVIENTQVEARSLFLRPMKVFTNVLEKLGFDATKLNKLLYNGQIIHEIDPNKVALADREDKAIAFNTVEGRTDLNESNIEEHIEKLQKENTGESNTLLKEGFSAFYDLKSERLISYFTEEYKERLENASVTTDKGTFTKEDISNDAKDINRFFKNQAGQIRKNAPDGIMTEQDNLELAKLQREKRKEMNPRNSDGTFIKGLTEYYDNTLQRWVIDYDPNMLVSDISVEAKRVWSLNRLSLIEEEFFKKEFPADKAESFFDKLATFKTEKEKWDFVKNNANISFRDDFWQGFKANEPLVNRLLAKGETDLVDDIRKQQAIINNILRQNREYNEPNEISVDSEFGISTVEKATIKLATTELQTLYTDAKNILKDEKVETVDLADTVTNKAYKKELEDSGKDEISFIIENTTTEGAGQIGKIVTEAKELKKNKAYELKGQASKVLTNGMTDTEIDEAVLKFAKSKLLAYYKRTEPKGYSDALNALEQGVENEVEGSVQAFIENEAVKISPNFIFFATSADKVNEEWLKNKEAGREQYTEAYLERVRNDGYYTTFGIDPKDKDQKVTKNQDLWKAREALLEVADKAIEYLGLTGVHSRYIPPQMHKSTLRRLTTAKDKKEALKEIGRDLVGVREDDLDYGQDINGQVAKKGSSLLTIPTYGVRMLDNQADVSDELLQSYGWFLEQAALHKARKNNIGDMFAIHDSLTREDAIEGKEAHVSNTVKMFKSFLDANFYGIKDTFSMEKNIGNKRVDIGKIARVINKYIRFSNLAGITVPITSLFQGKVQEGIEAMVGEVLDSVAYREAQGYVRKHSSNAAKEILGFNSKAELNVYGEFLGAYSPMERYANSGYDKGTRFMAKWGNWTHELGNFPVVTTTFMSVLLDYRWVGNTIMTRAQYKRNFPDAKDTDWKSFEKFIDQMPVENGVVSFKTAEIAKRTGLEEGSQELKDWIQEKSEAISVKALDAIQRVDSQIPDYQKSIAARDARANFFLMHMNWLVNAWQYRFKDRHFNQSTGDYQEGSWRFIGRLLNNAITNPKQVKQIWKETFKDELTARNAKRALIEVGVSNALVVMALLLAKANDDDEDVSLAMGYADYILTRVANEQLSTTAALPKQIDGFISSPLLAYQRAKEMTFDFVDVFIGDDEVTRGTYAGYTERGKYLMKNLPFLKEYTRLKDPIRARQTYSYFNLEKDDQIDKFAWLAAIVNNEIIEEE